MHDVERLIVHVRSPCIFQHLVTFIRTWAQRVGLYGQVFGYLGGHSWAILCAHICHTGVLSIDDLCSIDQFFLLVQKFFVGYSQYDWSTQALRLHACQPDESCLRSNGGSMHILCPSPPFQNSARSTTTSTRQLIVEAFQAVLPLLEQRISHVDRLAAILQLPNQFPHQSVQSVLQLKLSSQTVNELDQWIGWIKSRLARFLTACEDDCQLFVQTQAALESRDKDLDRKSVV